MLIYILIDVQYLQKAVFSFEKGLNGQNHSSSGSHHPLKNSPLAKFPIPYWGTFPAPLLNTVWKTVIHKDWLNLILCHV